MSSSQAGDSASAHDHFGTPTLLASDMAHMDEGNTHDGDDRSFFVRALYDYDADDATSLSFRKGTLIEVLTQLESGWWDGLLGNEMRGWFPSNYVGRISDEEAEAELQEAQRSHATTSHAARPRPSTDTLAMETALLSLKNGTSKKSDGTREGTQYADLGLGQDFDALRNLMNGLSTSGDESSDAFEQLAHASFAPDHGARGDREAATNSVDSRLHAFNPRGTHRMSDPSSQVESLLTSNSSALSNHSQSDVSSLHPRSNPDSLSDADGSRKLALLAAQEANAAVRAQLELIDKERLRAHTVSGLRDGDGQSGTLNAQQQLAGRPRAQTALPATPATTTAATANTRTGPSWPRSMSEQQAKNSGTSSARRGVRNGGEEDSFWVPKVNDSGEIYYFNTRTGQHARDLPDGGDGNGTPDLYLSDGEEEMQTNSTLTSSSSRKENRTSGSHVSSHASKGGKRSEANASSASTSSGSHAVAEGSSSQDSNLTMPDSRDVPLPWTVRTSEDNASLFSRSRQDPTSEADALKSLTSGGSTQPGGQKATASARSSSESRKPLDAELGPFRKTRNGRSASNAKKEDLFLTSTMRHADERDAWLLQQSMATKEAAMKSIRAILDEAGDAIATLASIASEQVGPDGLSEEDVRALPSTGNCLYDSSRLSVAIGDLIQSVRTLLQASGALGLTSVDLLAATESLHLVDGEAPSAFLTLMSKLQTRSDIQDERELDSYVTSASKHAVPPTPASLLPLGKKINATLSKLVLSARSVVEQLCLNVETRPQFTEPQLEKILSYRNRIKEDSMELARALGAFGNEAQRWRTPGLVVAAWTRRPQGILKSGKDVAGVGATMFVGGAAAGWRGQGFVLPTATETAALRAEAQGSYHNPFELTREAREALSSGKVALRRKPTTRLTRSLLEGNLADRFARIVRSIETVGIVIVNSKIQDGSSGLLVSVVSKAVQQVMLHFGALSALVEEIDLASALDVDGPATAADAGRISNLDRYMQTIPRARDNLLSLTLAKQAAYDTVSSLLILVQDESADALTRPTASRIVDDAEHLSSLLDVLMTKTKAMQNALAALLQIAEVQDQEEGGSLGARAKVYGIDEVDLKMVEDKAGAEGAADDVIYLGPGLAVPNGPPVAATTDSRVNTVTNAPSAPSSLRAMFQRGRSTSVATGNSANSGDSGSRILGQEETDAAIAALRGPVKTRRDTESAVSGISGGAPESTAAEQGESGSTMTKAVDEVPWYLQDDTSPEDIVFNEVGQVRGATLSALLGRLTMHNAFDSGFNSTFLMTYRSFTTTDVLLNSLFSRFRIAPPEDLTPEEFDEWVEKKQRPIRFRVFNVLKAWLELHFDDAENEPNIQRIRDFAAEEMTQTQSMSTPATLLLRSIERRSGRGEQMKITMVMPSSAPAPILPKNFRKIKFLDIDPLEMARQLTLMDSRLYNRIRPAECLGKSWSRENGLEIARNLRDVISANNRVSGWVSEAVLVQEDVKKRAAWVKQFVAIADRCLYLNNFSSLMSIYSGLNNASLNRLKRTWDAVNQRHLQMFDNMRDILAPTRNFIKYRETLRKLNPPCVPFLGVYLTDLTFLEDGNADTLKQGQHMINFGKRQMTAEKIQELMIYQSTPYNLTPVPGIQKFIEENLIEARSDDELFEQSLRLEPREREDEKIARLLQESGFL